MLQKCSIFKIAGIFFNEPTKGHYLAEISKKAKLAHTSAKKHLKELTGLSIINETIEKRGNRKFPVYNAETESKEYRFYKRIYNLEKIKQSKLINFLKDNLMPNNIVLFGSYARGEDIESSDIDLFLECKKEEIILKNFESSLNRKIQLHFKDNFSDFPKELKNNIANGIVLDGYLEAYK